MKDQTARAIGAVAELAGAEGAEQLVKKAFGEADNPYMEVLFDAMSLRTFTYNFNLHQEVKKRQEVTEDYTTIQISHGT